MPSKKLPVRPNLEQYKKQARDLVSACRNPPSEGLARIRDSHSRSGQFADSGASFQLSDAQLIIAREHGFESWPRFAKQVAALQTAQPPDKPSQISARIRFAGLRFATEVAVPNEAAGVVLLAQATSSERHRPANRYVASLFHEASLCTVVTALLTEEEELSDTDTGALRFDIRLLADRVAVITDWIVRHPLLRGRGLGYFGSGSGAAAMLVAAAERPSLVKAIVSSGGRPDLAGPWLGRVHAPTLFVVGDKDSLALGFNYSAMTPLPSQTVRGFEAIRGAGQSFDEPGAMARSAAISCDWFRRYLTT